MEMFALGKTFGLSGPRDLLEKLRRDIDRLRKPREDATEEAHVALDCALSAWALVDWTWEALPPDRADQFLKPANQGSKGVGAPRAFAEHVGQMVRDLMTCRLIATGAKHFEVRNNDDPGTITTMQGNDKDAPDDLLFGYWRLPHASIVVGEELLMAYRVFDRAARDWERFLDQEKIGRP
jgi:hypothetical protein